MSYLQAQIAQLIQQSKQQEHEEPYHEVLQWTATDGTQYIDTGFIADENSKIEIGFNILDTGTAVKAIFGSRKWNGSTVSQAFYLYKTNSAIVQVGWGSQSKNIALGNSSELQYPVRLIIDKGSVTIVTTSNTYTETFTSETFETPTSLIIGTCRTGTSGTELDNRLASVDVRYCRLWDNGTLVLDYKPALNNKMQPCLYDSLGKSFAYAKKISDDTATYDLTYKRWNKFDVDYISSSGIEYITTNIFPDQDTAIECTVRIDTWGYSPTQYPTYHSTNVFGSGSVSSTDAYTFGIGTPSTLTMGRRGGVAITGMDASLNTKYVIYQDKNGASYNDISLTYDSTPPSVKATTNPLTFFRNPLSNTIGNLSMYGARVWQSNNLILSLKPVVWHNGNTTAVACLYDEVYNKMYTNAGTGSFKAYIISKDGTTTYEVGSNCFVSPATASQQVTNNYFNSGLYGNESWNVKLISFTSTNVTGQLFGNFISSSATNNLTINSGTATGTGSISRFDGQAMSQDKIINMGSNEKSLLQMNKIGAWKDSTQIVAWSNPNDFTTTGTCYICGTNGSATVRPNGCCYLAIEEDNVLIAEYIPVRNKANASQYGLYDRVSGTLNTGIGTITFNTLT